eukprot:592615-Rhodomonas_salina.2
MQGCTGLDDADDARGMSPERESIAQRRWRLGVASGGRRGRGATMRRSIVAMRSFSSIAYTHACIHTMNQSNDGKFSRS